jgi:hypothetical protein
MWVRLLLVAYSILESRGYVAYSSHTNRIINYSHKSYWYYVLHTYLRQIEKPANENILRRLTA